MNLRDLVQTSLSGDLPKAETLERRDGRKKQWAEIEGLTTFGLSADAKIPGDAAMRCIKALSAHSSFRNMMLNFLIAAEVNQLCEELPIAPNSDADQQAAKGNPNSPWGAQNSGGGVK